MTKEKNNRSKTLILMACVIAAALGLLIYILFANYDLGRKISLLSYKKVSTYEELVSISEKPGAKYRLTCDIDMEGKEWTPFTFNGVLDGNGHSIKNLSLTKPGNAVRDTYDGNMKSYSTTLVGLFDVMEGAEVRNLTFDSVYAEVTSDEPCFVGTITGYMADSKISDCKVIGRVDLYAHDRMFGVGGVAGYGYGVFENVEADVTLVCVDTDRSTKDEQFMGGLIGAGYPDIINCTVNIDGYGSEHGYAHNGGMVGLYMFYPEGKTYEGTMTGNRIYGKITFFEENDDRRAYCKPMIGELLCEIPTFEDNGADFESVEIFSYDADLLPDERSETFEIDVKEQGRYELETGYVNHGSDATYGLYINGRFYKKVFFPAGTGSVKETVFLEGGKNDIRFGFIPGDGDITFNSVSASASDKSVTLIVVPHQDDEILGFAGTIQKTIAEGNEVKVLFLTNGDYYGSDYAAVRLAESAEALSVLGVDKYDITALGYGDMTLETMLTSEDPDQVFRARSGRKATYAAPGLNIFDYHTMNKGGKASYTGNNITSDLTDYITVCHPDRVYTTSEFEWHADHDYAFILVKRILEKLSSETGYHPVLCETVIHGEETAWPGPIAYDSNNEIVITGFTTPFPTVETTLDWNNVTKIVLTDEEIAKKKEAIGKFVSQNDGGEEYPGTREYNFSFCKRDEFYWEITY